MEEHSLINQSNFYLFSLLMKSDTEYSVQYEEKISQDTLPTLFHFTSLYISPIHSQEGTDFAQRSHFLYSKQT